MPGNGRQGPRRRRAGLRYLCDDPVRSPDCNLEMENATSNPRRPVPLIARVTIALLVVAAVPLAFAVWSLFDVNRTGMHEQVLRTHAVAAATAAERISATVAASRAVARAVAANQLVTADPRSEVSLRILQELLAADPSIAMVDLVTRRGDTVVRAQHRATAAQSEWARRAPEAARERLWTAGSKSWLLVSEPVPDTDGFARVLTSAGAVSEALDPAEIGEHARIILASNAGELLAGNEAVTSFPRAMVAAARNAHVNGTGVYRDDHGSEVLGAFAPVQGTGWAVLSKQPAGIAEGIALRMRRRAALAVGVAATLALLIAAAAQRTLVAPLRAVIASQQQLTGAAPQTGGTELDQLRAGTELLRRRILDQEDLGRVFLGRYQVLSVIGQGGMGAVFRGWDPKLRRQVALKTIRFTDDSDTTPDAQSESLLAEAVIAASVNHPNIVAVYDVEDTPGATFMAMELIDGVTLSSLVTHRGGITAEESALVGLAVAGALEAAHNHGLVHRDIKPANVLLGRDGSIKVTDFGIAAFIGEAHANTRMVFGTPGYIAPEAARGNPSGARGDLFALGVVLYECITGSNPFKRRNVHDILVATIVETPPALGTVRSGGPVLQALSDLVGSLMAKDPEARPPGASVVTRRLESLVRTHGLRWEPSTLDGTPLFIGRSSANLVPTISLEVR